MQLHIDTAGTAPVHEQLHDQVVRLVLAGTLASGTRLPSIRQLAADLGIAAGTVARAYRDLEQEAVVVTRRAQGTFVSDRKAPSNERKRALRELAQRFAGQAAQLGVTTDDALAAVAAAYRRPRPD